MTRNQTTSPAGRVLVAAVVLAITAQFASAQTAPSTASGESAANASNPDDGVVLLSPFEVSTGQDVGYMASSTLGGTRLNTSLRDIASQVSIMTPEFLEDVAATTLEDAFRYSLNVENNDEYVSATRNNGDYTDGIANRFRSRTRGLDQGGLSHDFFSTDLVIDGYNTERFTFASGPNAILFGLGSPSGLTDTTYKRAKTDRVFGSVGLRLDSEGSWRTTLDANIPIIRKGLAARFAYVRDDKDYWRKPADGLTARWFGTMTIQPTRNTSVRLWYEDTLITEHPMRNTIVRDGVTPWIAAGRPLFNNLGLTTSSSSSAVNNQLAAQGFTGLASRFTNTQQQLTLGQTATGSMQMGAWNNTIETVGPDAARPSPDTNQAGTLLDESIFPWTVSTNGNATKTVTDAWIGGVVIEQRITDDFFIEAGLNREKRWYFFTDFVRGVPRLQADVNMYLNDGVTPNPNVGRLYFLSPQSRASRSYTERDDKRLTASYQLDLTKRHKWLGRHRMAALASWEDSMDVDNQAFDLKIASNHSFTTGTPETQWRNANHNVRVRTYVDDPAEANSGGVYWSNLTFDPFRGLTVGDVQMTTFDSPYGASGNTDLQRRRLHSTMGVIQSQWLDDRLVTTFGIRHDNMKQGDPFTPLRTSGNSPYVPFDEVLAAGKPEFTSFESGNTRTLAVVAHPWRWLSLHYSNSDTFSPGILGYNPDGSVNPGSHGEGEDYGFTFAPFAENKVSLRVNFYNLTSGPVSSSFNSQVRNGMSRIERAVVEAGATPHPTYTPQEFAGEYYVVGTSLESTGVELSLTANPTDSWRVSVSAANSDSVQSEIGLPWREFARERSAVWAQYASVITEGTTTVAQEFLAITDELNLMEQSDGAKVESGRDWRVNATTRYGFKSGRLKNLFVGGVVQWRGKGVVGYAYRDVPNQFPFPGFGDTIPSSDITQPIYTGSITTIDAFMGYSLRLFENKVRWNIQLNIRNLFDDDNVIVQRAYSDGSPRFFNIPTPRTFILTNTFGF